MFVEIFLTMVGTAQMRLKAVIYEINFSQHKRYQPEVTTKKPHVLVLEIKLHGRMSVSLNTWSDVTRQGQGPNFHRCLFATAGAASVIFVTVRHRLTEAPPLLQAMAAPWTTVLGTRHSVQKGWRFNRLGTNFGKRGVRSVSHWTFVNWEDMVNFTSKARSYTCDCLRRERLKTALLNLPDSLWPLRSSEVGCKPSQNS